MESKLQYIFGNVNSWLNFAEAKNGALIAINASVIMGALTSDKIEKNIVVVALLILLTISLYCSLLSFVPLTGNSVDKKLEFWSKKNNASENLYLYSYIAKYGLRDLEYKRYFDDLKRDAGLQETMNKDYEYMIQEIIYNSKIVCRKYGLFSWALNLMKLSVVVFAIAMIIA